MTSDFSKNLRDLMNFDDFIILDLIKFIYFLGIVGIIAISVAIATFGRVMTPTATAGECYLAAFSLFFFGNFAWRIVCEILIVPFKMNESLMKLAGRS